MQAFTLKTANTKLTALNNSTAPAALQELFCNLVYHALVHGNASRERLAAMRDNPTAPAKFKAGLMKHMPVKWDKAAKQYNFDASKAEELRLEYGITYGESSFEDVAERLPYLFAKAEKKAPAEFNLADYLAKVAKHLDKNGIANADALVGLLAQCANNEASTTAAVRAAYKGHTDAASTVESNVA